MVVFPAPLGPITAMSCPSPTLNDTSLTARRPPKLFVTDASTSAGSPIAPVPRPARDARMPAFGPSRYTGASRGRSSSAPEASSFGAPSGGSA